MQEVWRYNKRTVRNCKYYVGLPNMDTIQRIAIRFTGATDSRSPANSGSDLPYFKLCANTLDEGKTWKSFFPPPPNLTPQRPDKQVFQVAPITARFTWRGNIRTVRLCPFENLRFRKGWFWVSANMTSFSTETVQTGRKLKAKMPKGGRVILWSHLPHDLERPIGDPSHIVGDISPYYKLHDLGKTGLADANGNNGIRRSRHCVRLKPCQTKESSIRTQFAIFPKVRQHLTLSKQSTITQTPTSDSSILVSPLKVLIWIIWWV